MKITILNGNPDVNNTRFDSIRIISDIYRRDAINFKTSFCFAKLTSDPVEEVANEINGI